jgi:tetratricopeptide (TPR) repeat protein
MRYVKASRALALLTGLVVCGGGAACHEGAPPAVASLGRASTPGDLDLGAPAIRFAVKPEPLLGLTASDGTGLRLAAVTAQAVVDGSVAFTELRLTFDNPESRTLEGRFRIALPSGAALQRFAMKIGEDWQESEVVELTAAREAYEDALHRKQDPALLESSGGNEFSARVFPIPANGRKELIVSYVQEVRQGAYVLPLRSLPEVGRLDAEVTVVGAPKQPPRVVVSDDRPSADLAVDVPALLGDAPTAIRASELAVVRVRPQAESRPDPLVAAVVLVDTSASRALGFEDELRSVAQVVARVAAVKGQVTVASFDQQVTPVFEGPAAAFGAADLARLRSHGALGASNLEGALAWAGAAAKKSGKKRVVLVTDGVATAGATDAKGLTATVAALRGAGIERVDAVATGGSRDDARLLELVRNLLPRDGVVVQASDGPTAIARRLEEATRSGVAVKVEGASWSWPTKLDGVQAGDELSIYAHVPVGQPVRVAIDGRSAAVVSARATARPLVERVVAQAEVASLLERELQTKQDLKKEITALAVRHRVLTPYTAMLVLETEQDYARFGIDRRTPPEVLAIDAGKILTVPRAGLWAAGAARPASGPVEFAGSEDAPLARRDEEKKEASGSRTPRPAGHADGRPPPRPAAANEVRYRGVGDDKAGAASAGKGGAPGGGSLAGAAAPSLPPPAARPSKSAMAPADAAPAATAAPQTAVAAKPSAPRAPAAEARAEAKAPAPAPRADREPASPEPRLAREQSAAIAGPRPTDDGEARRPVPPPPPPAPPQELPSRRRARPSADEVRARLASSGEDSSRVAAYTGRFKDVMDRLADKDAKAAFDAASAWRSEEPGDVMALIALGESAEALGAPRLAARAYGSIVDLFPTRADLRRFAGERLERLADAGALELAIDTFEKARADRPDHPASHRLLAMAYLRARQPQRAFEVLAAGLKRSYPAGRFRGVDRILREDLGLAAAAWIRLDPKREDEIRRQLAAAGGVAEEGPSLRFVLVWETDANDVDFHIYDGDGNHAFYGSRQLTTGGELYADVTTGYGPECFTVRGARDERAGPYKLQAHYYSRGPMGYGMGKLQLVEHDGKGGLTFEERPFVVMNDHAFVDLGTAD